VIEGCWNPRWSCWSANSEERRRSAREPNVLAAITGLSAILPWSRVPEFRAVLSTENPMIAPPTSNPIPSRWMTLPLHCFLPWKSVRTDSQPRPAPAIRSPHCFSRILRCVCSRERYGASRRFLTVFSPAASALRLNQSVEHEGLSSRRGRRRSSSFRREPAGRWILSA